MTRESSKTSSRDLALTPNSAATNNVPGAAVLELSDEDLAFFDTAMFDISPNERWVGSI
jgi:hypothetical protein